MAKRRALWAVAAGRLLWLLGMHTRRCAEKYRQQTEDRREAMQSFFHLSCVGRFKSSS
jgi:hypothetical protein